ncbi:hypothetical protein BJP34_19240 [Moorena producens PAL-8-15-08-1]|uniref:Uncharacterized protein n=1 Tax=Moorena producens PAL-8-15-08-1 TaxID=1458985 RepID=A0A1D8TUZ2_9CYAN|nr:hypothetical protein [Moorena producens]AOX01286.1 hypothetical protein BJP34_19240 [Moorena producens PAL-8-15-08-1]
MSETETKTKVFFGVSLELAGKIISLDPKNAIDEIKEKGIEVELPAGERVYLGTVGTSFNTILQTLGAVDEGETASFLNTDGTLNTEELPDITVLQNAANLLVEAGLYVDEFHVRIPGSTANETVSENTTVVKKDKTAYTVGLSAEWQDDAGQLIDGLDLKLRGIYFKVSNEE